VRRDFVMLLTFRAATHDAWQVPDAVPDLSQQFSSGGGSKSGSVVRGSFDDAAINLVQGFGSI